MHISHAAVQICPSKMTWLIAFVPFLQKHLALSDTHSAEGLDSLISTCVGPLSLYLTPLPMSILRKIKIYVPI